MFSQIKIFSALFESKVESLLPEEIVTEDQKGFENAIQVLRMREYDFLDVRNVHFDKDYIDFNVKLQNIAEKMNMVQKIWK